MRKQDGSTNIEVLKLKTGVHYRHLVCGFSLHDQFWITYGTTIKPVMTLIHLLYNYFFASLMEYAKHLDMTRSIKHGCVSLVEEPINANRLMD